MKTRIPIVCLLLLLSACSKNNSAPDNKSNTEKMLEGTWRVITGECIYYGVNNSIVNVYDNVDAGIPWTFGNGKITVIRDGNSISATYTITGDNILTVNEDSQTDYATITNATDSILNMVIVDSTVNTFGTPPVISTYNILTYHFKKL